MQLHWFSNRCPYFSAHDAERYFQITKDNIIKQDLLVALGFLQAARWLHKNKVYWQEFIENLKAEIELIHNTGGNIIYWGNADFPQQFKRINHPPSLLVVRGNKELLLQESIAIVGARHPTDLGRIWVKKNVPELVKNNFVIVSGGARGIDFEAHHACLMSNGKTVSFLPSPISKPYPSSHLYLFDKIVNSGGALVTEFLSKDDVRSKNFYQRNRLIAGLSKLVVIVEAAEKSGTLMTANKAMNDNNDVMVVPGSPLIDNYAGSLEILYQGAGLARHAKDIIEKINGVS